MNRFIVGFILVASIAALPAAAAGGSKGDWEPGLFGGFAWPDDYGNGSTRLNPDDDVLYGARIGYFLTPRWSVEVSGQRFVSDTRFARSLGVDDTDFDVESIRLNLLYNFRPEKQFRPFLTVGGGLESVEVGELAEREDKGWNAGGGLRFMLNDFFGVRLDGRYVSTDHDPFLDDRQKTVEATFGALWTFGGGKPGDADGDGVVDRRDRCPDTPRGARVDERGCPIDSDGDGVADGLDRCPETPPGVSVDGKGCPRDSDGDGVHDGDDNCPDTPRGAMVDASGCPRDSDGDGVPDGLDKCPNTAAGAKVNKSGCPSDADGDGVPDGVDACPDTPRGAKVDAKGCPLDSDGDGVFDGLDRCPGTPAGKKVDAKGCEILFEKEKRTVVLEGVNFEFDSAKLTAQAKGILDRVAMSLVEWPELRVEVAGHTDAIGSNAYNLDLSGRRAQAVMDYLASKGVDGSRMVARGYGEQRPIADNDTDRGRSRNRRVELNRLN